jgi:hypothetical protein
MGETLQTILDGYRGVNCPTTGTPCPSRLEIKRLCTTDYSEGGPSDEFLDEIQLDSRKETALLLSHTGLIRLYGCEGPDNNMCPPSLAVNEQPVGRGLKQLVRKLLERK